jgi:hypothetical protein
VGSASIPCRTTAAGAASHRQDLQGPRPRGSHREGDGPALGVRRRRARSRTPCTSDQAPHATRRSRDRALPACASAAAPRAAPSRSCHPGATATASRFNIGCELIYRNRQVLSNTSLKPHHRQFAEARARIARVGARCATPHRPDLPCVSCATCADEACGEGKPHRSARDQARPRRRGRKRDGLAARAPVGCDQSMQIIL